jgi:hypothetical protein
MNMYEVRNKLLADFLDGLKRESVASEDALRLVSDAEKHIKKIADEMDLSSEISYQNRILEAEIEEKKALINSLKAKLQKQRGEQPPTWKPEDLIGKLVHAKNGCTVGAQKEQDGILLRISDHGIPKNYRYEVADGWYSDIRPLTEDEALALVWMPKSKTRYDWSKAPEWARGAVIDAFEYPFWISTPDKAEVNGIGWIFTGRCARENKECILDASGDWRDSLERRPE